MINVMYVFLPQIATFEDLRHHIIHGPNVYQRALTALHQSIQRIRYDLKRIRNYLLTDSST